MGYHTDFYGEFEVKPPLSPEHREYLTAFNKTRRMARDPEKASKIPDPKRVAVGLPIGFEGSFFVGGNGFMGQDDDPSVLDHNAPPGAAKYGWAINRRPLTEMERATSLKASFADEIGEPCPHGEPHDYGPQAFTAAADPPHGCKYGLIDLGDPRKGQPGLWCQWVPTEDGKFIEWDQGEKFYDYVEWMAYLIEQFLEPWGYRLSGEVEWQGEEGADQGKIELDNNRLTIRSATLTWNEPELHYNPRNWPGADGPDGI